VLFDEQHIVNAEAPLMDGASNSEEVAETDEQKILTQGVPTTSARPRYQFSNVTNMLDPTFSCVALPFTSLPHCNCTLPAVAQVNIADTNQW
jgi:hypothetical protein